MGFYSSLEVSPLPMNFSFRLKKLGSEIGYETEKTGFLINV